MLHLLQQNILAIVLIGALIGMTILSVWLHQQNKKLCRMFKNVSTMFASNDEESKKLSRKFIESYNKEDDGLWLLIANIYDGTKSEG